MKRIYLDEYWTATFTHKQAKRKLAKYYRLLRGLYPHIPAKVEFEFKRQIAGTIADVKGSNNLVNMRFNCSELKCYKMVVREFLHEMVHVIWPRTKHGARFEKRIFDLRHQLFHDSMVIY